MARGSVFVYHLNVIGGPLTALDLISGVWPSCYVWAKLFAKAWGAPVQGLRRP